MQLILDVEEPQGGIDTAALVLVCIFFIWHEQEVRTRRQHGREFLDHIQTGAVDAALQRADVSPVDFSFGGEGLL